MFLILLCNPKPHFFKAADTQSAVIIDLASGDLAELFKR